MSNVRCECPWCAADLVPLILDMDIRDTLGPGWRLLCPKCSGESLVVSVLWSDGVKIVDLVFVGAYTPFKR